MLSSLSRVWSKSSVAIRPPIDKRCPIAAQRAKARKRSIIALNLESKGWLYNDSRATR
jgi:hypothetical protein